MIKNYAYETMVAVALALVHSLLLCASLSSPVESATNTNASKSGSIVINFAIPEHQPIDTDVAVISLNPQLLTRLRALGANPTTCRYYWKQDNHPLATKLSLDQQTGTITVTGAIDREEYLDCNPNSVCCQPISSVCEIGIGVSVRCNDVFVAIDFILGVADENDNAPRFIDTSSSANYNSNNKVSVWNRYKALNLNPIRSYLFRVGENQQINAFVGSVRAIDPDVADNARVQYSLNMALNNPFRLTESGDIYTRQPLDREMTKSYKLFAIATDSGSPQLSDSASVTIEVQDENDNKPTIECPKNVTVPFVLEAGEEITQISAFDIDSDDTNLTYSIVAGNEGGLFSIDRINGSLRVAKSLVDDLGEYTLLLRVDDNGSPNSLQDEARLIVSVINKDASGSLVPCRFNLPAPNPEALKVSNKLTLGKPVLSVNFTSYACYRSKLNFTLTSEKDNSLFAIDSRGTIRAAGSLRNATGASFALVVRVVYDQSRTASAEAVYNLLVQSSGSPTEDPDYIANDRHNIVIAVFIVVVAILIVGGLLYARFRRYLPFAPIAQTA